LSVKSVFICVDLWFTAHSLSDATLEGTAVTSYQYEELCRHFLAEQLDMKIDEIVSVTVPNPTRQSLCHHSHQIDLYWETWDFLTCALNIANAKWRGNNKVSKAEVLLLQQVRQKVGAHKAIMITNSHFSGGAAQAAKDDGIGLLIVRPEFDYSRLARTGPAQIRSQIQEVAKKGEPLYSWQIERKGLAAEQALWQVLGRLAPLPVAAGQYGRRIATTADLPHASNKALDSGAAPGYATRDGPGLGFRTK
jgi:hypothetical protein